MFVSLNREDAWLLMQTKVVQKSRSDQNADKTAEKSSVHKGQDLVVLDRTFDSILI